MSVKKAIAGGLLFLLVPLCFGVTWQKESVEFQFPGVGVRPGNVLRMADLQLTSRYDRARNALVFSYSLPGDAHEAHLKIYTLSGSLVQSVKLSGNARSASCHAGSGGVVAGTYIALLKCGTIEKNLRIALVK